MGKSIDRRHGSAPLPLRPSFIAPPMRKALSAGDLNDAASNWAREGSDRSSSSGSQGAADPTPLDRSTVDHLDRQARAGQDDVRYESFLASATPGSSVGVSSGSAQASADQVAVSGAHGGVQADRLSAGASMAVGDHGSLGVSQTPLVTSFQASLAVGGPQAGAFVGGGVWTSGKIKGAGVSSKLTNTGLAGSLGFGGGLTAVMAHKVAPLAAQRVGANGELMQLARVDHEFMPIADVSISATSAKVGVGARLAVFGGHHGVLETYVPVDKLAKIVRQRDGFLGGLRQNAAALGMKVGIEMPSARKLAEKMPAGYELQPGSSFTFTQMRGLSFGLSAGGMGVKATVACLTQSGTEMALQRPDEHTYQLSVMPSAMRTITLGAEAAVVGEAYATLNKTLVQRRVWSFDSRSPDAMAALGRALKGELPAVMLPAEDVAKIDWQALKQQQSSQTLPKGVTPLLSQVGQHKEQGLGVALMRPLLSMGLKTPLAASRSSFQASMGSQAGDAAAGQWVSKATGSRTVREVPVLGARQEQALVRINSVPTEDGSLAFAQLEVQHDLSLQHGPGRARVEVARRASQLVGQPLSDKPNPHAQRSPDYAVQGRWTMQANHLERLWLASADDVEAAHLSSGIAVQTLSTWVAQLRQVGDVDGPQRHMQLADLVATFIAQHGRLGSLALRALLGASITTQLELSVDNARGSELLSKVNKVDVLQQTARTGPQIEKVLEKMKHLDEHLEGHIKDVNADALARTASSPKVLDMLDLLGSVRYGLGRARRGLMDEVKKKG